MLSDLPTSKAAGVQEECAGVGTNARLSLGHILAGRGSRAAQGTRGRKGVLSQRRFSDIFS